MKIKTEETYYIVSVKGCYRDGDPETLWLSDDGGYPSNSIHKNHAHKFNKPPAKGHIDVYNGCPWYFTHIPNTEKIYKIVKTVEIEECIVS